MSQTETLLLVVLGFALATLIALFVGRLLWATALKLGARRMQKQVPTTLVGLQTERDRLRAEYAMLSQRLGTRLENAKLRSAEQMAEVSRHRNRLESLEAEKQASADEISGLKTQVAMLTGQLADSEAARAALQQTISELQSAHAEVQHGIAPEAQGYGEVPEGALADADPERRLRSRIARLNKMAHTVARDRSVRDEGSSVQHVDEPAEPPLAAPTDPLIIAKLQEAEQETGDLQKELEQLDAEWSRRLDEMKEQEAGAEAAGPAPTAVANVISLANRIRDLKKGLGAI